MTLEKLSNKVNPKKNIHRSTWKVEIDKITCQNWEQGGRGVEKGEGEDKGMGEENLREWDSRDG